jgi:hypothetical protein
VSLATTGWPPPPCDGKGGARDRRPSDAKLPILLWLRLARRLLLLAAGPSIAGLPFTAVHAAIAIPVRATIGHAAMSLMGAGLAGLRLAVLHRAVLARAMLLVALMLLLRRGRRCLRGAGRGEGQRHRGNEKLHDKSPERSIERMSTELQERRGGGGSDSGWRPRRLLARAGAGAGVWAACRSAT